MSAQLRAKIRSLDGSYQNSPVSAERKTTYVVSSSSSTGNNNTSSAAAAATNGISAAASASANMIHNELHGGGDDSKSMHSDSSMSDITSGETSSRSRRNAHQNRDGDHKTVVVCISSLQSQSEECSKLNI